MRSAAQIATHCWLDEEVRLNASRVSGRGVICNMFNPMGNHAWPIDSQVWYWMMVMIGCHLFVVAIPTTSNKISYYLTYIVSLPLPSLPPLRFLTHHLIAPPLIYLTTTTLPDLIIPLPHLPLSPLILPGASTTRRRIKLFR